MPYPDQMLTDDEQVVRHLHPHWMTLVAPVGVFVATSAVAAFLSAVAPPGTAQPWLRGAVVVVTLVILLRWVLVPFLRWKTTHYVITTDRVLIRTGILRHIGRDIPLQRINDVAFEQSLLDRIIGAGTLQVESAGETGQTVLHNIPHSDEIQQLINRLIEEDSRREAAYRFVDPPPEPHDNQTRRLR